MKKRLRTFFHSVSVVLVLAAGVACSKAEEKLGEKDQAFVKAYVDVLLVQAWYESLSVAERKSYNKPDSLNMVLAHHKTSRDEFQEQMLAYKSKPKLWKEVLKITLETIEEKRRSLSEKRK